MSAKRRKKSASFKPMETPGQPCSRGRWMGAGSLLGQVSMPSATPSDAPPPFLLMATLNFVPLSVFASFSMLFYSGLKRLDDAH